MKTLPLILVALLAGCAAQPPRVAASNERSVIVKYDPLVMDASTSDLLPVAEEQCKKNGRHARYNSRSSYNEWVFDCVD